ncbi:MAG: T9SS type A sorting domain-containing protein [Bacteroidetes bacterium]|nr:T9SS type A sorting domain-containing protein [Bacteroidota bacterium]
MNKVIFSLFILVATSLQSQNYENICSLGTTYYHDYLQNLKAFRKDSVNIPVSGDTIFTSYRAIHDTSNGLACDDTTNGSVLGRKVYKKSNGWFFFFNRMSDTVKINTQALLNENWKFYLLPSGSYIQATVASIVTKDVLGTPDLVKIVSLQAKNSSNVNISHILNGRTLEMSQHYGLTKILDVYYIPGDTTTYFLAGKTNPSIGLQPIGAKEIYNFDIGDEFHYFYQWSWIEEGYQSHTIHKILAKTVYGNYDSIGYSVQNCLHWESYFPHQWGNTFDTVTITYNLQQLLLNPIYSKLPDELVSRRKGIIDETRLAPWLYETTNTFNQRLKKGGEYDLYFKNYSTCWETREYLYYLDSIVEYANGIGQTYSLFPAFEGPVPQRTLVYFKKGTETWGTPVGSDCNSLVGIENEDQHADFAVQIFPNPVKSQATILFQEYSGSKKLDLILYSVYGTRVFSGTATSDRFILNRNGIPAGCYFMIVMDKDGVLKGRAKVIFE